MQKMTVNKSGKYKIWIIIVMGNAVPSANAGGELSLLVPSVDFQSDKIESSIFEQQSAQKLEFSKAVSKTSNGSITSSQWKSREGIKIVGKYLEKQLDARVAVAGWNAVNSAWEGRVEIPLLSDSLQFSGEIKTGQYTSNPLEHFAVKALLNDPLIAQSQDFSTNSLVKYAFTGKSSWLKYGFQSFRVGMNYKPFEKSNLNSLKKDTQGYEYWLSRDFADFNLKASYSSTWNNLDSDVKRARLTDELMGLTASYTFSSWPYSALAVTYQTGTRASSSEPKIKNRYSGNIEKLSADFSYSSDALSISAGSLLSMSQNDLNSYDNSKIIYHYLSGGYQVWDFYVSPGISLMQEFYNDQALRYTTITPSLSLSYSPKDSPFNISLYVSQNTYKGNDSYTNNDTFYGGFAIEWRQRLDYKTDQIFSFKIDKNSYSDRINREFNQSDVYIGFNWTLTNFL